MEGKEKWVHVRVFLIVLILHAAAVFLFTRGFLLTRTELNAYSTCHDPPIQTSSCWTPPAVDRLVIVVLDALRFDFVAPSAFFDEKKPWMDKLTVLQKLGSSTSARLFKAIADPPTTSLQRLKGLTTGGLPTFIDVGNSFGAPAIVEDNLIYQLAKNGKRVLMMGDDTWLQLFPDHFDKSYPYPSFNVKDLDTVDDGCIEHLIPSLYKDDWDVLIAHFLGVDHAGHIFGVDSEPMIQKLEQYNSVLEKVIDVLKNNSGPGGLHENTYFIVMGDHGQTINGDHGGGTPEEVETSLFAMSLKSPPTYASSLLPSDFCRLNVDGEKTCVGSMQQIDFAVTIAALLGIPFPFGSIGRVNSELYALSARTWEGTIVKTEESIHTLQAWIENYMNTLRLNCWQVKRYIDLYSATSVLGFSYEDLQHVAKLYSMTQITNSSYSMTVDNVSDDDIFLNFKSQISVYSKFLEYVAELARSKWTEFNLTLMGIGLLLLFVSIFFQFYVVMRMYKFCQLACPTMKSSWTSRRVAFPILLVAIRGGSFLSNSYILTEGKVANFLLATTAVINLRDELAKGRVLTEDVLFLILNVLLRFSVEGVLSKQVIGSISVNIFSLDNFLKEGIGLPYFMVIFREILPIAFVLSLLPFLYKRISGIPCKKALNIFIIGVTLSHALIALYWTSESSLVDFPAMIRNTVKTFVPRAIYSIGCMLVLSAIVQRFQHNQDDFDHSRVISAATSILCAWTPTIMILLGKQGPFVACVCILGVWCVIRMQKVSKTSQKDGVVGSLVVDPMSITQWSLLAACLFFYTGHWCNFDGLRYGAAFIGFDQFILLRQAILLAIDTFGASHLLPVLALPLLVGLDYKNSAKEDARSIFVSNMTIAFLIFGLEAAITTTFTVVCVTIQRRHLMVWGLFTPKYVFDAIGLLIIDVLIFLSSLYYY